MGTQHMAKTPSRLEGVRQTVKIVGREYVYCRDFAKTLGHDALEVVLLFVRDAISFFDLSPDQVQLLEADAKAKKLSQRDYVRMALSERSFSLRVASPEGAKSRSLLNAPEAEDQKTTIRWPVREYAYLGERSKDLGYIHDAVAECIRDQRTFFSLPTPEAELLEAEAHERKLDHREYIRFVLSERTFSMRLAAQREGASTVPAGDSAKKKAKG